MPLVPFSPCLNDESANFDATPPLPVDCSVGVRHFHAIDPTRDDVSTEKRQFMISVFYPALPDAKAPQARLTDILAPRCEAALELLLQAGDLPVEEQGNLLMRCWSFALRAQRELALEASTPRPVLIYYPGGASHRLSNAALCEQLVCAGYIVFTLDAPRDAPIVVFPDCHMVPFLRNNDEDYIWPRVADVRFLLDGLEELNVKGPLAGILDLNRIGMFGHSRGGYLSNICAVEDARIRAAVNMDGLLWGLWTAGTGLERYPADFQERAHALKTPILRLCGDQGNDEATRSRFINEAGDFGGDFIFGALTGFSHSSFSSTPWMNGDPENFARNVRQLPPPPQQIELLTKLLTDFFDAYLRSQHSCLMDLIAPREECKVFSR